MKSSVQKNQLIEILKEGGIVLVGFGNIVSTSNNYSADFPTAISLIINYGDVDCLDQQPEAFKAKREKIIATMKQAAKKASKLLQEWGYKVTIPAFDPGIQNYNELSNDFPHKLAATKAGLGWIGKSDLLITPQFGPRIRLATILTNAPFETAKPINEDECGKCTSCVDICPIGAIKGASWEAGIEREALVDAHSCYRNRFTLNDHGETYRCGKCLQVCPIGQ